MFAFGVIGCRLLDLREELCPEKKQGSAISESTDQPLRSSGADASVVAESALAVPLAIAEIITSALSRAPTDRWSIREYVDKLDELSDEFYAERDEPGRDRVQWTTLNWSHVYEQAFSNGHAESSVWKYRDLHGDESSTWALPEDTPPS